MIQQMLLIVMTFASAALCQSTQPATNFPRQKVLFYSKSAGFEHGVVKQTGGKPSLADRVLTALAEKNNIDLVCSKDGSQFSAEYLKQFDALIFFATGDLTAAGFDKNPPMTPEGRDAFLKAIESGTGFVGIHAAADCSHKYGDKDMGPNRYRQDGPDAAPYIQMLGGEFIKHDKEATAPLIIVNPKFPGIDAIPANWTLHEEWYTFKNFAGDLHVILLQDTAAIPQPSYARPNYPMTWARMHGKGKVFYTSLGHRPDVWNNPVFQSIVAGGTNWALGRVQTDVTPNIAEVAPGANTLPEIYRRGQP